MSCRIKFIPFSLTHCSFVLYLSCFFCWLVCFLLEETLNSFKALLMLIILPDHFQASELEEVVLFNCVAWGDSGNLLAVHVSFLYAAFQLSCKKTLQIEVHFQVLLFFPRLLF